MLGFYASENTDFESDGGLFHLKTMQGSCKNLVWFLKKAHLLLKRTSFGSFIDLIWFSRRSFSVFVKSVSRYSEDFSHSSLWMQTVFEENVLPFRGDVAALFRWDYIPCPITLPGTCRNHSAGVEPRHVDTTSTWLRSYCKPMRKSSLANIPMCYPSPYTHDNVVDFLLSGFCAIGIKVPDLDQKDASSLFYLYIQ